MASSPLRFFDPPARIHLIGVKGVAMTGVAELLLQQGYVVTGSDTAEVFPTDAVLKRLSIVCANGFAADHVGPGVAAVIYSTAYGSEHVERRAASAQGIPQWSYPEFIGWLFNSHRHAIAVAGSHGKTTTTALLARLLEEGGLDPTAVVGSTVSEWGSNARLGRSSWFVLEADEYQNKFQYYRPRYLIITNVDYDHPDFFSTPAHYEEVFLKFAATLPLLNRLQAATRAPLVTYGEKPEDTWQLVNVRLTEDGTMFDVMKQGKPYGVCRMSLSGLAYALDALGALALADASGVPSDIALRTLARFRGTARRLEYRGEYRGALVIDDYAHHPAEIRATLTALRQRYPGRRLWCVFQPHTFSRTSTFLQEFAQALAEADQVVLLPIYSSVREAQGTVSHETLVQAINLVASGLAWAVASHEAAVALLKREAAPHDIIVTMGAGDVWQVGQRLLQE